MIKVMPLVQTHLRASSQEENTLYVISASAKSSTPDAFGIFRIYLCQAGCREAERPLQQSTSRDSSAGRQSASRRGVLAVARRRPLTLFG